MAISFISLNSIALNLSFLNVFCLHRTCDDIKFSYTFLSFSEKQQKTTSISSAPLRLCVKNSFTSLTAIFAAFSCEDG